MRRRTGAAVAAALALFLPAAVAAQDNPLESYVQRPEPAFEWQLQNVTTGFLADLYRLRLVSQQWLDGSQVDHPLWTHELHLALPRPLCGDSAQTSTLAVLVISGGRNTPEGEPRPSSRDHSLLAGLIAQTICRPVFELRQVPNQPLLFTGQQEGRREDAILAYSMDRYLSGEPGDWPAQMAMVKATVQAMNAAQAFSRTRAEVPDIERFVLLGASKRGWTAWLTAAVDPRVQAIIPVSIDMPNMAAQFPHFMRAYGDYTPALADYKGFDIGCRMAGARGAELLGIIDPWLWRERLSLPKLLINSAGDEFFISDSSRFYYDALPGPKRLRYTVNTDHDQGDKLDRHQLFLIARNWIDDLVAGREPPRLDWERPQPDLLVVRPSVPVREMRLWRAENPQARDFRLETIGPAWESKILKPAGDGSYRIKLRTPKQGWRAVLVEGVFGGPTWDRQQSYTTGVYVLPETLPYPPPDCARAQAAGAQAPADPPSRN
ncbi:MAG TPA: PhoPQ-activated protein PqaA family protein [Solimonas sp.]|nr:PhoPQ-activated protein PqaA family protein [Solimonas sp.]